MSNILEIRDITVMYGKSIAIHDISLNVPEGKVVTMVGANGAGKSTTLKALAGIVPVTKGSIRFQDEELVGQPTQEIVRKGVVLVPEGRHLFPYLSVYKNLQLGATLRTDKEGIQEDLEYIYQLFPKLKDRRKQKAGTLSGGEQQMLAIARGIMAAPKLLCLDEPSLGLAPVVIEQLGESIKDINKTKGVSILLVEQNVHLAFGVADYCYAMSVGAMVAEGDVECISCSDAVRKAYFGG
ncbi:MAG: ABC transporter ATP-binding protein [Oscillospiraceae bacterium]|jgi:branched-chain amino acid transport system ATP-binding protein